MWERNAENGFIYQQTELWNLWLDTKFLLDIFGSSISVKSAEYSNFGAQSQWYFSQRRLSNFSNLVVIIPNLKLLYNAKQKKVTGKFHFFP